MDASGVGARSGLPWTACATPEGSARRRGSHRPRLPVRDKVDALLRQGGMTALEIVREVGCVINANYVRSAGRIIGHPPLNSESAPVKFNPRPESEIRADLARQLEDIDFKWHEMLTTARRTDPI